MRCHPVGSGTVNQTARSKLALAAIRTHYDCIITIIWTTNDIDDPITLLPNIYISQALSNALAQKFLKGQETVGVAQSRVGQLSDRELEVLHLLGQEKSTSQIAA